MSKPILIVDKDDRPIGQATKQEVWDKGLIHRVVRIMIQNDRGQILLQHRAATKDIFPSCWDNSSAGHVDAGENYEAAVRRELEEEVGLSDQTFTEVGRYRSNETWKGHHFNRFTRCYKIVSNQTPVHLEAGKIDGWQWLSLDEVKKLVRDHPDQVTDGLKQVIAQYY